MTRARLDRVIYVVGGALAEPSALLGERRAVWLRLRDQHGFTGWGEAAPLPGYSPDSLDDCRRALEELEWPDITDAAPTPQRVAQALDALFASIDPRLPAARCAAEMALLDLWSRRWGVAARLLLGSSERGGVASLCPVLSPDAELGARARALIQNGASCLKIKLGRGDLERELALLDALPRVALRFDFNRACPPAKAREVLAELARYRPEFVEEPVAPEHWDTLDGSPIPIGLDETLQELELEQALTRAPRLNWRVAVLKPMTLGGLTRCRAISERARAAGLDVVISHLFDGPVALNAYAELALSLPASLWAHGLMPHAGLAAFPPAPLSGFDGATLSGATRSQPGLQLPGDLELPEDLAP